MQATYALDGDDVLMQKAPGELRRASVECFWPLVTGCRLVLAASASTAIRRARGTGAAVRVTTLHFVPPLLQLFIDLGGVAACGSLRRLPGGEALSGGAAQPRVATPAGGGPA